MNKWIESENFLLYKPVIRKVANSNSKRQWARGPTEIHIYIYIYMHSYMCIWTYVSGIYERIILLEFHFLSHEKFAFVLQLLMRFVGWLIVGSLGWSGDWRHCHCFISLIQTSTCQPEDKAVRKLLRSGNFNNSFRGTKVDGLRNITQPEL